jgi:uncharacterized protein (TIGR02145 family)
MKKLLVLHLFLPILCVGQIDTLIDARDGKMYRTIEISGVSWMLDNLDLVTEFSTGLTPEQIEGYKQFSLSGRYYHFQELDAVCPAGWRLPDVESWSRYFKLLVADYPEIRLDILSFDEDNHYTSFMNYNKSVDLFKPGNPLNLRPTGRIEGKNFNVPDVYADYWTHDDQETFKGKSHIHIMNAWTTIHSHKHNLQERRENKLRKFMVRCVTYEEKEK